MIEKAVIDNDEQFRNLCVLAALTGGRDFFNKSRSQLQAHKRPSNIFETALRKYELVCKIASGDYADLYGAYMAGVGGEVEKVVIKIVADPADNDLAQNEWRVLDYLATKPGNQQQHLPQLIDRFKVNDPVLGQGECCGSVFRYFDGLDILELRNLPQYRDGFPAYDAGWALERALSVLGFCHKHEVFHGNIEATHIMLRGRDHGLYLIDWGYASINPNLTHDRYRVINEIGYSPPEISKETVPNSAADIFSLGKSMVALLGGDVSTSEMPEHIDERFQRFIGMMIRDDPEARPKDAWDLYHLIQQIRREIWGKLEFKPLEF